MERSQDDQGFLNFLESDELLANDTDRHEFLEDQRTHEAWKDLEEIMEYDKKNYEAFIKEAEAANNRHIQKGEFDRKYSSSSDHTYVLPREDLDLLYTNYGKGKYGECPLYPGKDPNYVMVDHCYPTFKYRWMRMYLGSLYGFQDRINHHTKPQFIGRRYNVNGMNSLDPLYYQSMDDCYGDVTLPFGTMKNRRYFPDGQNADECNVKFWKCEWDDRVFKTMPRMERQYFALTHNGVEDFGRFVQKSEDDVILDHIEHYRMDGVKQFEDGGRCTKWKSPGHVWLEVPPDDVIVEFGGSDRPFILDQTFCLTRPLRRRLVEDNKMSNFQRVGGNGKLESSGLRFVRDYSKTGGNEDELNTLMHGIKSIQGIKENAAELKEKLMKAKDVNSTHLRGKNSLCKGYFECLYLPY